MALFCFSLIVLLSACTNRKKVTYFQPNDISKDIEQAAITQNNISKLQTGDILGIMVSSLSPEASAMFNPYMSAAQNTQSASILPSTPGYLIDTDGNITLPLVGKLKVAGLSNKEVTDLITEKLTKYLAQPTVNVRILNFKISVLGEVNRPSVYVIPNEKVTLPEALSLAGDLTIFGRRKNILLIREVDGKREFARIDITKRDFFNSPYYYLRADDVIYVEPGQRRISSGNLAMQLIPLALSTISLMIVIIVNAKNL